MSLLLHQHGKSTLASTFNTDVLAHCNQSGKEIVVITKWVSGIPMIELSPEDLDSAYFWFLILT
jgi:predicted ABC-class ATPase